MASILAATLLTVGCSSDQSSADAADRADATNDESAGAQPLRAATQPTESVGMSDTIPLDPAAPEAVLGPLLDPAADSSTQVELGAGLTLRSDPHPKTSEEVVLGVTMATEADPPLRTITQVPASKATGSVFIQTVQAALAQDAATEADATARGQAGGTDGGDGTGGEPVRLEYRSTSANGGKLTLAVVDEPGQAPYLEVDAQTPTTSIANDRINSAAYEGEPYESIYGLVWFGVSRDQFDFFVNRAYGLSAGKAQNFDDFQLVPHNWLRLTVTPQLDRDRVDVSFEVVTLDGERVPFARAPASLVAGEQFKNTVFAQMDAMSAAEAAAPGSSRPWTAPFYYDDPEGGGVVEVIAQGQGGHMKIAYAGESPVKTLTDVDFVPYQGKVEVPDDWDAPDPTCTALASTEAAAGRFEVTFAASSTVQSSPLDGPLTGTVYGSIYHSDDVEITGPLDGTQPAASFTFPGVDSSGGPSDPVLVDTQLPSGSYQILGFMDIDGNADPAAPSPDAGDPVFIPIGGFELTCALQPAAAEFALLLPASEAGR